jgi:hypothetical protein
MIKKVFGDNSMSETQLNCGTVASQMVGNPLRAIDVLEGLQQAEHPKMLKAFGLQSTKSGD